MEWILDTEPFELKPHITRKRVMRGLTPERRKWKDSSKLRRKISLWRKWTYFPSDTIGVDDNGIPYYYNRNGDKVHFVSGWDRSFIDGKFPHKNGKLLEEATGRIAKSSRRYMKMIASWWQQASTQQEATPDDDDSER